MHLKINLGIIVILCIVCAETQTPPQDECSGLEGEDICCGNEKCGLFKCDTDAPEPHIGCHALGYTGEGDCKEGVTPNNTCPAITPAQETCVGKDKEACCAASDTCMFVHCTAKDNETATIDECRDKASLTDVCADPTNADLCDTGASTAAPTPTPAPGTTLSPEEVNCNQKADNSTCCADDTCMFVSCKDMQDQDHTGCHSKTANLSSTCKDNVFDKTCEGTKTTQAPPATSQTPAPTSTSNTTTQKSDASANTGNQEHGQHFDGASFVGGIVLCAGLVAIVFFGLKFYRAKADGNYSTLREERPV